MEQSVPVASPLGTARPTPAAKIRVLDTARVLFARDGIRVVGVDRLIRESSVTKATFYKHFGSKDRLIRDYLSSASADALEDLTTSIASESSPRAALFALADRLHTTVCSEDFRGSLFVNAAAEFPDQRDAVRVIIAEHHEAIAAKFTDLLHRLAHPLPGEAADELMAVYVGALTWGHTGDPIGAASAFRRIIERVLADAPRTSD